MGFCHILKHNKGNEFPSRFIFFDTETTPVKISPTEEEHHLKLGWAVYYQRPGNKRKECEEWVHFTHKDTFWDFVETKTFQRTRLYIIAHQLAFDGTIVQAIDSLGERGWKLKALISDNIINIWTFTKERKKITFIDSLNLFTVPLKVLGKVVGLEKLEVDFATVNDEDLSVYCKRDTEILLRIFQRYESFLSGGDLGSFKPTIASQALGTFTHNFMQTPIYIHDNEDAILIERASYKGGRCECFYIGDLPESDYYYLDFCSMYPYIMKNTPVPTKLEGIRLDTEMREFEQLINTKQLIAHVRLQTDEPIYPYRMNERLVFPVGDFWTVLPHPELYHAYKNGRIKDVREVAIYETNIIFEQFVDYFYDKRIQLEQDGNSVFAYFCKIIMNSLYGKFAQQSRKWEYIGEVPKSQVWFITVFEPNGNKYSERAIGGRYERLVVGGNSPHSLVAISSFITSAARLHLYEMLKLAGRENCYYCDTDSIFTNEEGMMRLRSELTSQRELGKLKLEFLFHGGTVFGAKDYITDGKQKTKGIKKNAIQLAENVYLQDIFPTLRGLIRKGNVSSYVVTKQIKHLSREYTKGEVTANGIVHPFEIAAERFPLSELV